MLPWKMRMFETRVNAAWPVHVTKIWLTGLDISTVMGFPWLIDWLFWEQGLHEGLTVLPFILSWNINIYNPSNIFARRDWSNRVTWPNISQLKLGNIREYSQIFKTARVAENIWRIINTIASIWRKNMLGYLSLDIICSSNLTVFLELRSWKTVPFWEQIMSGDITKGTNYF